MDRDATGQVPGRVFPDGVPILVDPASGVSLRATEPRDLPAIVEQSRDPVTIRWTTSVPTPPGGYTLADAEDFYTRIRAGWAEGRALAWTIEGERNPSFPGVQGGRPPSMIEAGVRQYCGLVNLRLAEPGWAEIGFAAHPAARGRSMTSAAVRLVRDYAFDVLGLTTLRWRAVTGNWASRRVAAAAGFVHDGTVRRLLDQRGVLVDGWVGTLTREDPRTPRRGLVPVELPGAGVTLRPFRAADAGRVVEACTDPRTRHWLVALPSPYTRAEAVDYIEHTREVAARGSGLIWCIAGADDDRCLGSIGLEGLDGYAPQGEIGYWAHPDARGRGAVTEAVRLVSGYARSTGLASALVIRCAAGNAASRHVAEQASYAEVGRLPQAEPTGDGNLSDLVVYALP